MATVPTQTGSVKTLADVLSPLVGVPLDRIRVNPAPGSATVQDVIDVYEREGVLCELVAGVLVEKAVGYSESLLASLIIEILSQGNTPQAMAEKRRLYFEAGVDLIWEIEPEKRSATGYRSLTDFDLLSENDRLDGGAILPGFSLSLAELFAELDRRGPS